MKTVIEMAREAGYIKTVQGGAEVSMASMDCLERLVELARADEREACVKAADDQWVCNPNVSGGDAIRARSNT
jgi:hypothetical protein